MEKILIIDDEKEILESLSSILRDEGFSVFTARDGKEGIETYISVRPDLVLLDVWMPEMDGIEVLRRIKEIDRDSKVVVISGHGNIQTAVEAVKKGANDFIEKPLSIENVLEVITRCLKKSFAHESSSSTFGIPRVKGSREQRRQKTISKSLVLYGHGLHTGCKTGMILLPMPENTGIIFEHVPSGERIPAFIDFAYSAGYATSIKGNRCVVRTVEHLLAALHMFGITNLLVKVSEEVPILDGSAKGICDRIMEAGISEQEDMVEPIMVNEKIELRGLPEGKYLSIEPSDNLIVDFRIWNHPPINDETYVFVGELERFLEEIAPARTYGFLSDFERLAKMGLGEGGRIDNVILLDSGRVINTRLRYDDEFVRHKILDLIGDLYLLSRPIIGKITARQTGHIENLALVREIRRAFAI